MSHSEVLRERSMPNFSTCADLSVETTLVPQQWSPESSTGISKLAWRVYSLAPSTQPSQFPLPCCVTDCGVTTIIGIRRKPKPCWLQIIYIFTSQTIVKKSAGSIKESGNVYKWGMVLENNQCYARIHRCYRSIGVFGICIIWLHLKHQTIPFHYNPILVLCQISWVACRHSREHCCLSNAGFLIFDLDLLSTSFHSPSKPYLWLEVSVNVFCSGLMSHFMHIEANPDQEKLDTKNDWMASMVQQYSGPWDTKLDLAGKKQYAGIHQNCLEMHDGTGR